MEATLGKPTSHDRKRKANLTNVGPIGKFAKTHDKFASTMHRAEFESILGLMVLGNADHVVPILADEACSAPEGARAVAAER